MRRFIKGRRPSVTMIIASLALVFALGGTAVAVVGLNGKQKKQVKKISKKQANKRITARAPGLTVGNANALGGASPAAFEGRAMWALVQSGGNQILAQSGGISVVDHFNGGYYLHFPASVAGKAVLGTPTADTTADSPSGNSLVKASVCGGSSSTGETGDCGISNESTSDVFVFTANAASGNAPNQTDVGFYVTVLP